MRTTHSAPHHGRRRRFPSALVAVLAATFLAACSDAPLVVPPQDARASVQPGAAAAAGAVPEGGCYRSKLSGSTFYGNTRTPTSSTRYTRHADFRLDAWICLLPGVAAPGNFKNGVNPREVFVYSGSPAASPRPGAVWFATNSMVYWLAGLGGVSQQAAIDVAHVSMNAKAGTVSVRVHEPAARAVQLNSFTVRSGLTASLYQVIQGTTSLQFRNSGRNLSGSFDFIGTGYLYPGSSRVKATFTGVLQ
ncbi:MAG TPA: hypothetical protein VFQ45_13105 [Longimicrobium sp.]|nr:hypothetical protein [Longimicrobium sp.]